MGMYPRRRHASGGAPLEAVAADRARCRAPARPAV